MTKPDFDVGISSEAVRWKRDGRVPREGCTGVVFERSSFPRPHVGESCALVDASSNRFPPADGGRQAPAQVRRGLDGQLKSRAYEHDWTAQRRVVRRRPLRGALNPASIGSPPPASTAGVPSFSPPPRAPLARPSTGVRCATSIFDRSARASTSRWAARTSTPRAASSSTRAGNARARQSGKVAHPRRRLRPVRYSRVVRRFRSRGDGERQEQDGLYLRPFPRPGTADLANPHHGHDHQHRRRHAEEAFSKDVTNRQTSSEVWRPA